MPASDRPDPKFHPTTAAQADIIRAAFNNDGLVVRRGHQIDFMYQKNVLLVRDEYLSRVLEIVRPTVIDMAVEEGPSRPPTAGEPAVHGIIGGLSRVSLDGTKFDRTGVTHALGEIEQSLPVGAATPNHILYIVPGGSCPATEPEEVRRGARPDPEVCKGRDGEGTFVYVADSGWLKGADKHPWLAGVTGRREKRYKKVNGRKVIPEYTGHGTFIAGLVRCLAPAATVHVARLFNKGGARTEVDLIKDLQKAMRLAPDVINFSAGGTSRLDYPLLSFEYFFQEFKHVKGVVFVCAAGNRYERRPFWPAAFPETVSVGALAADRRKKADFSNFGHWVDGYAPGENLINAFGRGRYICNEPPHKGEERRFRGMARWSGTSFSTPIVAGLIAARMSRTGENGRQAADALLARARAQAIPGLGAVLYPCLDDNDPPATDRHPRGCRHC